MEKLEHIDWRDEFSVFVTEMDEDHGELFSIYNEMVDHINSGKSREEFALILSKMTDYGIKHLKGEEKYMRSIHFPKYEQHKKLHKSYTYKVAMFNANFFLDNSIDPLAVAIFLRDWWVDHITRVDSEYMEFWKSKNDRV